MENFRDIKEVLQERDNYIINKYLAAGWVIVHTASGGDSSEMWVMLGRPESVPEGYIKDDRVNYIG